jgi:hypothetical protein
VGVAGVDIFVMVMVMVMVGKERRRVVDGFS